MCDFDLNIFLSDYLRVKKASAICKKVSVDAEKIKAKIKTDVSNPWSNMIKADELSGLYANIQRAAIELYRAGLHRPSGFENSGISLLQGLNLNRESNFLPKEDRVTVRLNRLGIFVRTPLLWTKNGREKRDSNGAAISNDVLFLNTETSIFT